VQEDTIDHLRVSDTSQEVLQNYVLIVLAQNGPRFVEAFALVDQLVMGAQESYMQLPDDQIFIVTRVAGERGAINSAPIAR
jgi:hypothetical protein